MRSYSHYVPCVQYICSSLSVNHFIYCVFPFLRHYVFLSGTFLFAGSFWLFRFAWVEILWLSSFQVQYMTRYTVLHTKQNRYSFVHIRNALFIFVNLTFTITASRNFIIVLAWNRNRLPCQIIFGVYIFALKKAIDVLPCLSLLEMFDVCFSLLSFFLCECERSSRSLL